MDIGDVVIDLKIMSSRQLALLWLETYEIESLVNGDTDMDQGSWHKFRIGNLLKEMADYRFPEEEEEKKQKISGFMELYDHLTQLALRIQNAEVVRLERGRIINRQSKHEDRRLRKLHRQIQEKLTESLPQIG